MGIEKELVYSYLEAVDPTTASLTNKTSQQDLEGTKSVGETGMPREQF